MGSELRTIVRKSDSIERQKKKILVLIFSREASQNLPKVYIHQFLYIMKIRSRNDKSKRSNVNTNNVPPFVVKKIVLLIPLWINSLYITVYMLNSEVLFY